MKLTNAQMWESIQTLTKTDEKGKLGYACARNLRKLLDGCHEYMKVRDKLLSEYGTPDGNGRFTFEPDKVKKFSDSIVEYANISHDVDVMRVDEETFYSGNLTTKDMYTLAWMVKEENDVGSGNA